MGVLVGSIAGIAVNVVAALLPRPGGYGRGALAIALSAATLTIPFVVAAPLPWPAILAALMGLSFARVCEIVRAPGRFGPAERAVRLATIFETRLMRRAPRRVPVRDWLVAAALLTAGILVLTLAYRLGPAVVPYAISGWPRWIAGAAGGYLFFDGVTRALVTPLPLLGWEHAPIQRAPIRSRSLAEFWGFRWNRAVGLWLQRNLFEPLARRGMPRMGILLAFLGSSLLHFYLVFPAAGLIPALWMAAFFLAHGVLAAVERVLGVKEWPPPLGHAFVGVCFLATLPLFSEPLMRIMRADS